jgi:hypothetical protein
MPILRTSLSNYYLDTPTLGGATPGTASLLCLSPSWLYPEFERDNISVVNDLGPAGRLVQLFD